MTTNCSQLKMKSSDGKMYLTDVADTELLLRIIQLIPSPKAEPFKIWLAQVGYEPLDHFAEVSKIIQSISAPKNIGRIMYGEVN